MGMFFPGRDHHRHCIRRRHNKRPSAGAPETRTNVRKLLHFPPLRQRCLSAVMGVKLRSLERRVRRRSCVGTEDGAATGKADGIKCSPENKTPARCRAGAAMNDHPPDGYSGNLLPPAPRVCAPSGRGQGQQRVGARLGDDVDLHDLPVHVATAEIGSAGHRCDGDGHQVAR